MKKPGSLLFLIVFLVGSIGACTANQPEKGSITIAVAESKPGTEAEPNPHSLYAGALMAAEQMNDLGGVDGYKIVIVPYADSNDAAVAETNAQAIVQSDAMAVIGHSVSETTTAAAPIYQAAQMSAIAASPMTRNAINGFDDYFNISYTSEQQGAYLANYARHVLKADQAMIVFTDESSNAALAGKFENTFHGLGGTIVLKQSLQVSAAQAEIQLAVGKVFSTNSGVLLIAANDAISTYFVKDLKNRGFQNPIIGGDNLSTRNFIDNINKESAEQARPGYFTDNIITTRALMPDSVSGFASQFVRDYQLQYPNIAVSNSAARGYDAALALFRAIQVAQEDGAVPSRESIAMALHNMDDPKTTFYGVTGPVYFSHERFAVRQPLFGIYQYGHLISAPIQYQPVLIPENVPDLTAQMEKGHIITLDGHYVYVTHIVYTGMDIIEVRDLDQKASVFTADFYLWFRYIPVEDDPEFQPENITFTNAQAVNSNDPVRSDTTSDGSLYNTFRISGEFKSDFNFRAYPFDRQDLFMQFRNQGATATFIQYVIDRPGMRYPSDQGLLNHLKNNGVFDPLFGWKPLFTHADQKLFSTSSTLGDPLNFDNTITTDFSLFDIHIQIQRDSLNFVIKSLLPLFFTLVLAYIAFYLPLGHSERLGVGSTALLTTAFFHLSLASSLPEIGYTVAMEYFFYASYVISALIVFLETWSIRLEKSATDEGAEQHREQYEKKRNLLNLVGRVVYPTILFTVLALGGLVYIGRINLNPDTENVRRAVSMVSEYKSAADIRSADQAETGDVTLELVSWRPEDDAQIQKLLSAFNKKNPDITVVHLPIFGPGYRDILSTRLNNGNGPDMFFLHPFESRNAGFTLEVTSLPIEKNFEESHRIPWRDTDGKYFGLPYVGVVQGVYYNKDIFKELELAVPATWEEFLLASDAIKQAGYTPIANSLVQNEENDIFMSLAVNFIGGPDGRKRYNINGGRCFNDPHAVRALQSIEEIAPYMSDDFKEISSYTSKQRFINQEAAMLFGGSWDVRYFEENVKFDWGVFVPPAPAGSQTYVIFQPDVAIGVNKNISSAHQQASLRFLEWLLSEESLNMTLDTLPGFYPLSSQKLNSVKSEHSAEFQRLATEYPTDLRWSYSELSISDQIPAPADLMQRVQYHIVADGLSARESADGLQAGLAQWYEPAQTCKP